MLRCSITQIWMRSDKPAVLLVLQSPSSASPYFHTL